MHRRAKALRPPESPGRTSRPRRRILPAFRFPSAPSRSIVSLTQAPGTPARPFVRLVGKFRSRQMFIARPRTQAHPAPEEPNIKPETFCAAGRLRKVLDRLAINISSLRDDSPSQKHKIPGAPSLAQACKPDACSLVY